MTNAALAARNRIVWMDLEMTGLDETKDYILEAACLITDQDLNIVAEGPNIIINQPDSILDGMGEWCKKTHGESGLTEACRNSNISVEEAQEQLVDFIGRYTNPGECPLAGNSIGEDKRFLYKYMPKLINHLHYRIIDVSTIKELGRRWNPDVLKNAPPKSLTHRAMDDIKESLIELSFYKANIFK
ncbi:hypothetical protein DAPPUDRAFT_92597 [Daphnia pulex]|uniref:Probable oligoribonuclease n=1 Tax=Daphnia pulex TaxID=6669 RepID=E9GFZ1_DAPPU|nr:hypothetical protein DAPPUDRAFT_92597 [Daphnia pulex]|eukprot:EFX81723.1 hypothetical protein DAPPUDRAFT_92597 [Daphnia pulex]